MRSRTPGAGVPDAGEPPVDSPVISETSSVPVIRPWWYGLQPGAEILGRYLVEHVVPGNPEPGGGHPNPLLCCLTRCVPFERVSVKVHLVPEGPEYDLNTRRPGTSRLERSAGLLARLEHPGVARLVEFAVWERLPVLVTSWTPGRTLMEVAPTLTDEDRLSLALQLARACQHLHERGVVHRDIKPRNIVVDRSNDGLQAVLIDFDLAEELATPAPPRGGTLGWSAPEQLRDEPWWADPRTDLFALGTTLAFLLLGRHPSTEALPREGDTDLARSVRGLLKGLLHPDPRQRFASADDVVLELEILHTTGGFFEAKPPREPDVGVGWASPRSGAQLSSEEARTWLLSRLPGLPSGARNALAVGCGYDSDALAATALDLWLRVPRPTGGSGAPLEVPPALEERIEALARLHRTRLDPADDPEAHARAAVAAGRWTEALETCDRHPDEAALLLLRAQAELALDRAEAATRSAGIAAQRVEDPSEAQEWLAMAHVACGDTEKALEALQTSTWSTEAGLSLARRRRIVEVAWRSGRFLLALDACHGAPDLRLLTDFAEAVAGRLRSDHHRRGPLDLSTTRDPETWSALGVAAWVLLKEGSAVPESFGAWLRACIAGLADLDPDGGRCLAILQQAIEEPAHGMAAPLLQALQKGTLGVAGLPGAFACPLRDLWARVEEDPAPAEGLAVALLLGRLGASAWALEHAGRQLMGHPMQDGLMGRVHLVLGRPERACELLEEVGDQFGDEDRWTLALAHCAGGDVAMGLERLRQLHLAHASVDSALWLCRGFDLAGAPSAALPVALEAWKEHGPQDALIGTLITGLAASGRIQQALDLADDAVRVLPANWLAHQLVASLPYALDASRPAEVRQRAAEALAQMGARPTWHARLEAIFHDHPTLPNLERVVQAWLSLDAERARSWVQEGLEVLGPSPELTGLTARVDAMIEQPAEALSSDEADFLAGLWDGGALWDWCQAERFGRSLGLPPGVQATTRAGMEIAGGPIAIDPEGLQQAIRAEPECPDLWRLLAWRATCGGRGEVVMATATELSGLGVVKAECLGWSIAGAALSSRLQEGLELGTHLVESGGRQAGPMLILGVLHLVVGQVEAARALMGSPPLSGLVMAPPLAAQVLAHLDRSWITALEFHADGLDVLDNESMAWLRSLLARSRTGSREALATCSEAAASHSTSVRLALLWALSAHRAQDRGELTAALARLQALDSDWEAPMLSLLLEEGDRRLPRWSQEAR